jgi:hypothetical protein
MQRRYSLGLIVLGFAFPVLGSAAPALAQSPVRSASFQMPANVFEPAAKGAMAIRFTSPSRVAPQATKPAPTPSPGNASPWQLEFHGGVLTSGGSGGDAALPPAGVAFILADGFTPSRASSSWYFGDGAALFNQIAGLRGLQARITPLDSVLKSASAKRGTGGSLGVRVSRDLNRRISAEFSLDFGLKSVALTDEGIAGIEASRASFVTALVALNNSSSTLLANPAVTSGATTNEGSGGSLVISGALNFVVMRSGQSSIHVTAGVGMSPSSDGSTVTLVGNYRLTGAGGAPFNETDTVTIHFDSPNSVGLILGGGFKRDLSKRSGIRADVRLFIGGGGTSVTVDAAPSRIVGTPIGTSILNATSPGLQFTTSSSFRTSLSGDAIAGFETFKGGSGLQGANISFGYFLRF